VNSKFRWCCALAVLLCAAAPVPGQTLVTVGVGASAIEYEGFLPSGAGTLTGAIRHESAKLALGLQGGWTVFESGNPIIQTTAAAAWLTQPSTRWGFEFGGSGGLFRYASEDAQGHILLRARGHFLGERAGSWLSFTTGASFGGFSETPVEVSLGAWTNYQNFSLVGTATSTFIAGAHILDVSGALRLNAGRVELEGRVGGRPMVDGFDDDDRDGGPVHRIWGEASATVRAGQRLAVLLSAGSYPSDPVRRVLGANYASAGLRLALGGTDRSQPLALPAQLLAAVRAHTKAATSPTARLEIVERGDSYVLRVFADGASSIDVSGDFTDWQPQALKKTANGSWELATVLTPGVHRLNIRIDGGEWVVPSGARPEEGDFGMVGVLVIR
jgi:hypothetical protein